LKEPKLVRGHQFEITHFTNSHGCRRAGPFIEGRI
jgi:hypothetical protein